MERWFELGRYQPVVAGIGVIVSAIVNPDGVAASLGRIGLRPRQVVNAAADGMPERGAPIFAGGQS
jgi:hypothetical protein